MINCQRLLDTNSSKLKSYSDTERDKTNAAIAEKIWKKMKIYTIKANAVHSYHAETHEYLTLPFKLKI